MIIVHTNQFEEAFSDFLDSSDCDKAEEFIFVLARSAFSAGWQAAGGPAPTPHRLFEVIKKDSR